MGVQLQSPMAQVSDYFDGNLKVDWTSKTIPMVNGKLSYYYYGFNAIPVVDRNDHVIGEIHVHNQCWPNPLFVNIGDVSAEDIGSIYRLNNPMPREAWLENLDHPAPQNK